MWWSGNATLTGWDWCVTCHSKRPSSSLADSECLSGSVWSPSFSASPCSMRLALEPESTNTDNCREEEAADTVNSTLRREGLKLMRVWGSRPWRKALKSANWFQPISAAKVRNSMAKSVAFCLPWQRLTNACVASLPGDTFWKIFVRVYRFSHTRVSARPLRWEMMKAIR